MRKQLHEFVEAGVLSEAVLAKDGSFPITIITEGVGSTGVYNKKLLENSASVFPKGTKSFIDHPADPKKPWERSLTKLSGKLAEDARYVVEDGVGKLKSRLKVDKKYQEFVEEYKDVIGVSIYIGAYGDQTDASGKTIIEEFDADDPYKSVDLVVAGGRGGRFDLAMESYRQITEDEETSTGESQVENDGSALPPDRTPTSEDISSMEIAELAAKVDTLSTAVEALTQLVTPVAESLKPRENEPEELDLTAVTEALIASSLTKNSRKVVLEAVRNGAVLEDAIKSQKAVEDEFRAELRVQEGYVQTDYQGDVLDLGKVF